MRHIVRSNPTTTSPAGLPANLPSFRPAVPTLEMIQRAKEKSKGVDVNEGDTKATSTNTKWWILGGVATLGVVGIAWYALKD